MAVFVFALLGGAVGAALLGGFSGFVFGAAVGALAGVVADLAGRVRFLERRLDAARKDSAAPGPAPARVAAPLVEPNPRPATSPPPPMPLPAEPVRASTPPLVPARSEPQPTLRAAPAAHVAAPATPSVLDTLFVTVVRWFTTGNVPVKVGVVLSLFGVAFLVKEGVDRQWFTLPIEFRFMLAALFGLVLLAVGWRLRARQPVYALSMQGGGIGVLYLTIYAAFAQFELLPAALAFALLVVVTVAAGVLAVLQDAKALAVLGVLGGFLAPVLASTGSGNHVALFSYYALLNCAVFGIAWFKAWRVLNVLGFVFTFGIGALWGSSANGYVPAKFATTEPFLILFTLMYLVIPVLFALKSEPKLRGFVDGTLMFGTPIVAFALQSRIVAHTEYGLAFSAVVLAAAYVALATYLYRRGDAKLRVLVEAQLALGVAFITVAVPLALDARWTSAAWALQGAALVWLGFRQNRKLALAAGLGLQLLSGASYAEQPSVAVEWPIVNGYYLGTLLLALAGFFSARMFDPRRARPEPEVLPPLLHTALAIAGLVWAGGWWWFGGVLELERQLGDPPLNYDHLPFAVLVFTAGTALLSADLARRIDWPRLGGFGLILWPVAVLGAVFGFLAFEHPAELWGWFTWPAVVGAMLAYLWLRDSELGRLRAALHAVGFWLAVWLLARETHWLVDQAADGVWPSAAALAMAAACIAATLYAVRRVRWPLAAHAHAYVLWACGAVVAVLACVTVAFNIDSNGAAAPLPYVPLVNPLELASVLVVMVLLKWLGALGTYQERAAEASQARGPVAAAAAWFLVTMAVARAVHYWAGVPYDAGSLMASTTFQGALSIVWGGAGLAAMIVGARGARRAVWLTGAALMAVVVGKLFLIDLGNTGTLARIVSFLGVGVLLLVVGYFAPAPPRAEPVAAARSN